MDEVLIVFIVFSFVFLIVKTVLHYAERMARIKHGYPLDDKHIVKKDDFIDYTNQSNKN